MGLGLGVEHLSGCPEPHVDLLSCGGKGQKALRGVGSPSLRVSKGEVGLCTAFHRWGS